MQNLSESEHLDNKFIVVIKLDRTIVAAIYLLYSNYYISLLILNIKQHDYINFTVLALTDLESKSPMTSMVEA